MTGKKQDKPLHLVALQVIPPVLEWAEKLLASCLGPSAPDSAAVGVSRAVTQTLEDECKVNIVSCISAALCVRQVVLQGKARPKTYLLLPSALHFWARLSLKMNKMISLKKKSKKGNTSAVS